MILWLLSVIQFSVTKNRESNELLKEAQIEGVRVEDKKMVVDDQNRQRVTIEEPADALVYVPKQQTASVDFLFAGNLENNLIYQSGYDYSAAVRFHRELARLLRTSGIYTFSTNDIFFNDLTPNSAKNVMQVVDEAGLDILYKATQYTHILNREKDPIMTENCVSMCAKSGDYERMPKATELVERARNGFSEHYPHFTFIEGEGTIEEYKKVTGQSQTNLVLIKIDRNKYHWFNMSGQYVDVFAKLATDNDGFYPDFLFKTAS